MFCIGIFLGHSVVGSQVSAFNNVTNENMGKATTLYNMLTRVGAATGIAIVAMLLSLAAGYFEQVLAYKIALLGTVGLLSAGFFFTFFVKAESGVIQGQKA